MVDAILGRAVSTKDVVHEGEKTASGIKGQGSEVPHKRNVFDQCVCEGESSAASTKSLCSKYPRLSLRNDLFNWIERDHCGSQRRASIGMTLCSDPSNRRRPSWRQDCNQLGADQGPKTPTTNPLLHHHVADILTSRLDRCTQRR